VGALGIVISFIMVYACAYLRHLIYYQELWLLLVPLFLSIVLNITIIELYNKYKKK